MGAEVLIVGALGWPAPTEDKGFWRPALGELSMAEERNRIVRPKHSLIVALILLLLAYNIDQIKKILLLHQIRTENVNADIVHYAQSILMETEY